MIESSSSSQTTCKSRDLFIARTELVRFFGFFRRRHTYPEARHSGIEASVTIETPQTHTQTYWKQRWVFILNHPLQIKGFALNFGVFVQKMNVQVVFLLLFLAVGVDIIAAGLSADQGIPMSLKTSDKLWICCWYKSKFAAIPEHEAIAQIMAINLTDLQKGNIEPSGKAKLTNSIILVLFSFFSQIGQSMLIFYVMQYSCSFVWPLVPQTHFIYFHFHTSM